MRIFSAACDSTYPTKMARRSTDTIVDITMLRRLLLILNSHNAGWQGFQCYNNILHESVTQTFMNAGRFLDVAQNAGAMMNLMAAC
jgi:hypothetical protein